MSRPTPSGPRPLQSPLVALPGDQPAHLGALRVLNTPTLVPSGAAPSSGRARPHSQVTRVPKTPLVARRLHQNSFVGIVFRAGASAACRKTGVPYATKAARAFPPFALGWQVAQEGSPIAGPLRACSPAAAETTAEATVRKLRIPNRVLFPTDRTQEPHPWKLTAAALPTDPQA